MEFAASDTSSPEPPHSPAHQPNGEHSPDPGRPHRNPAMSSTSSEDDDPDPYDSPDDDGFATADENDPIPRTDEPDPKRHRTSEQAERERRMERYARATKASLRELEAKKRRSSDGAPPQPRAPSSREPSRSRSEGGRSKSPRKSSGGQFAPARVGKRVRRAPQRWEGERKVVAKGSVKGAGGSSSRPKDVEGVSAKESDGEGTLSANSCQYEPEAPVVDNPIADMRHAVKAAQGEAGKRGIVDSFHTWQLQAVSKQAAQQKALQVFLKRKLRKRSSRLPEIERLEEDALKNARNTMFKSSDTNARPGREAERVFATTVEDETAYIVPSRIRLPLEAYLPRRVRASKTPRTTEQIMDLLPDPPTFPAEPGAADDDGDRVPLRIPTVDFLSSLNTHKDNAKQKKIRAVKGSKKQREVDERKRVDD